MFYNSPIHFGQPPPPRATYPVLLLPTGLDQKYFYTAAKGAPVPPTKPQDYRFIPKFQFELEDTLRTVFYAFWALYATWLLTDIYPSLWLSGIMYLIALYKVSIPFVRYANDYSRATENGRVYEEGMEKYTELLAKYEKEAAEYNSAYETYRRSKQVAEEKKARVRDALARTDLSYHVDSLDGHPIGASETLLYSALCMAFPGMIMNTIFIKEWADDGRRRYTLRPDMTYCDATRKLMIAIEVDEPYVHGTGEPIHCGREDDERNEKFTRMGWIVVRFSEQQVVKHTRACVRFIDQLCHDLCTLEQLIDAAEYEKGHCFPKQAREPRWTYEEARQMAANGHRESYNQRPGWDQ